MALSTAQQASRLFKLIFRKAERDTTKDFYEENTNTYPNVYPSDVWIDAPSIPNTAPGTSGIAGVVNYVGNLTLVGTPVYPHSFTHPSLYNVIPFNFGDGSYNYSLQTQGGTPIPFGTGDWLLDTESGVLTFYNGLPSGVSSSVPPVLSFYQYAGAQNTGVIFINATGTNNYASSYPLQTLSKNVMYITQFQNTNTGASTLNINGLGGKPIKTLTIASPGFLEDTANGELNPAGFTILAYDGTNFQIVNSGLSSTNAYIQNGNSFGTTASIGTSDNNALAFITNRSERMRLSPTGNFMYNSLTNDNLSNFQINDPTAITKLYITGDTLSTEAPLQIKSQTRYITTFTITVPGATVIGDTISINVIISGVTTTLATYTATSTSITSGTVATNLVSLINSTFRQDQWVAFSNTSNTVSVRAPIGTTSVASGYNTSVTTTGTNSILGTGNSFTTTSGTLFLGVGQNGAVSTNFPFIGFSTNGILSNTTPLISPNGASNSAFFNLSNGSNFTPIIGPSFTTVGATNTAISWNSYLNGGGVVNTSGEGILLALTSNGNSVFSPTSGSGSLTQLKILPQIAQSTGCSGITRGVYVSPTLGRSARSASQIITVTNAGTSGCIISAISTVSGTPTTCGSYTVSPGDTTTSAGAILTFIAPSGFAGNSYVPSVTFTSPGTATVGGAIFVGGWDIGYAVNWRSIEDNSTSGYSYYQSGAAKNYFQGITSIGGTASATGATLTVNGNISFGHLIGNNTAPSASYAGGSIASGSIVGDDLGGIITMTSVPSGAMNLNVILATINFSTAFASAPTCIILSPANQASSNALAIGAMPYVDAQYITTTQFIIISGPTNALSFNTTYKFYYFIKQ